MSFYGVINSAMRAARHLRDIFLEALFPRSEAEHDIQHISADEALTLLPPAPPFVAADSTIFGEGLPLHAIFGYKDERVRKLVWNIKYKKDEHSLEIAAHALLDYIHRLGIAVVLIPIPSSTRRVKERGYNQCHLIIEAIRKLDGSIQTEFELLKRNEHRDRQTLKSREERMESAHGVFTVDPNKVAQVKEEDATIIVVDDVITTGSTIKEAILTLHAAGFEDVSGLSLAH